MIHHSYIKIDKIEGASATMIEIVDFSPNTLIDQISQMSGYLYTEDKGRSFVPYDKPSYNYLKSITDKIIILPLPGTSETISSKPNNTSISPIDGETEAASEENNSDQNAYIHKNKYGTEVEFNNMNFYIKVGYRKEDIKFLKKLQKTYWSGNNNVWVSKASTSNLEQLQNRFGIFDKQAYAKIGTIIQQVEAPYKVTIYYMPQSMDNVCVKIEGHRCNHEIMKRVANRSYNKGLCRWIVPNDERVISFIRSEYIADGARVYVKLAKIDKSYTKVKNHLRVWLDNIIRKLAPEKAEVILLYTNSLISTGYKATTIKAYTIAMIKYMEALGEKHIVDSTVKDYEAFMTSLYNDKLSDSLVNTYNSALKYCFKKVYINSDLVATDLVRPRKGRSLPKVLSVGEIDRMLRATDNVKHVTLLYTLYSSGLRLNEILNLKLTDMWWERNQILVHGKGNKERLVLMADVLKRMLIRYYEEYQPVYWLFEGRENNVQYSTSSVQKVIKRCALKANIGKRVTTHTMRHCFATHLMDSGVGIRYIQELLGHKDIKTTLIYTHVTNLEISKIQSPLDNLMQKHADNNKI